MPKSKNAFQHAMDALSLSVLGHFDNDVNKTLKAMEILVKNSAKRIIRKTLNDAYDDGGK